MLKPYYIVFGKFVSTYSLFCFMGIAFAVLLAYLFSKRKALPGYDIIYSAVFTLVGAFVGAKALFLIVNIPDLISGELPFLSAFLGGFVFYGGFLGGALGLFIYCKLFKMKMSPFTEVYALVLPLGHAYGRMGCFAGGCCYGMEYDGWYSYTYTVTIGPDTPKDVPLFPIQLVEAAGLILIFIALLIVYLKTDKKLGYTVPVYLVSYSVLRFVLEFFRGDTERGGFLGLSTSQWISIGLLLFAFIRLGVVLYKRKNSPKEQTSDAE